MLKKNSIHTVFFLGVDSPTLAMVSKKSPVCLVGISFLRWANPYGNLVDDSPVLAQGVSGFFLSQLMGKNISNHTVVGDVAIY